MLLAAGCSGTGSGCGSSCGGAFSTVDANGNPYRFTQGRLDNVAQLRVTKSGLDFLDAAHLNQALGQVPAFGIGCIEKDNLANVCSPFNISRVSVLVGDNDFNGSCGASESTPVHLTFRTVTWALNPGASTIHLTLSVHVKTDNIYVRTKEEHSNALSSCGGNDVAQARFWYDDEDPNLNFGVADTSVSLDLGLTNSPDGRVQIDLSQQSLIDSIGMVNFAALGFDGNAPGVPTNTVGQFFGDGCDNVNGSYSPVKSDNSLACAGLFDALGSGIGEQIKTLVIQALQTVFQQQIANVVRTQFDNFRCQRAFNPATHAAVACTGDGQCGNDDDGHALSCDTARGVCTFPVAAGGDPFSCEPIPLGVSGVLDASALAGGIGFAPDAKLDIFAGLGGKTAPPAIDSTGIQLSVMAATKADGAFQSACVPPAFPSNDASPPTMNFDDAANLPAGVLPGPGGYQLAFSVASSMLNRGFLDAYNAGMLCIAISSKTSSLISSGLFKTFLPSLGLVTGGKDVPMAILLRPSAPPHIRVGRGTEDNTTNPPTLIDPLMTLNFTGMNLDFYALVDERMVRLFTIKSDLALPIGLRVGTGATANTLLPVLGSLDTVLTNVSASNNEMLAEDPGVVTDLLAAAVRLAQPLLASVLKPIALPSVLGLNAEVAGVAGAVAMPTTAQGYQHLAVWTTLAACANGTNNCARYTVKTVARLAEQRVPELAQTRGPGRVLPAAVIEASALQARSAKPAEFSYRLDGSLWSPWVQGPRFTISDPVFLFQGHHAIEVIAREAGDDKTADPEPVALDFFVSLTAPSVALVERADGAVVTQVRDSASAPAALLYSYRFEDESRFSTPGAAREISAAERKGRGVFVSVTDEGGRSSLAEFDVSPDAAQAQAQAGQTQPRVVKAGIGCSTASDATAWGLLPLFALALLLRRRRANS